MFLKLDYVFAPLSLFFSFFVRGSYKFYFLHILLDIIVGLTPFHFNKKCKKWTDLDDLDDLDVKT